MRLRPGGSSPCSDETVTIEELLGGINWRARHGAGSAGKPAGQDEEGEHGSEGDDSGADQRAPAEAGNEGPVHCRDDRRGTLAGACPRPGGRPPGTGVRRRGSVPPSPHHPGAGPDADRRP